jgi:NADPH:quinone reductase-like Zn-dependent oxidoreductase
MNGNVYCTHHQPLSTISTLSTPKMTYDMNAAIYENYGAPSVLQILQIAKPVARPGEILIKIHATAVNSGDVRLRMASPFAVRFFFGLFKPGKKVLGGVFSGVVEAVGEGDVQFKPGDEVFGATQLRFGAYAEYICLPANGAIALKPSSLSHEEAAAIPFGGTTAYHFLNKANIKPGQRVLVYGASGAVGSASVQLAKYLGAEVTAVCSTKNMEAMRSLGADHVVDYTKTDFSKTTMPYDVVYETVNKAPIADCFAAAKTGGTVILGAAMLGGMLQGLWHSKTKGKKLLVGVAEETTEAMVFLWKMAVEGRLKPLMDKTFELAQIAEAHAFVEAGHKRGNVVVRV